MAIAVAHDVSQYYNSRGSSTFTCSLDAEGAFDHIPHSVIFGKLDGMMPDHYVAPLIGSTDGMTQSTSRYALTAHSADGWM